MHAPDVMEYGDEGGGMCSFFAHHTVVFLEYIVYNVRGSFARSHFFGFPSTTRGMSD